MLESEKHNLLTGFLLINKPKGKTSFYCIKYINKLFDKKDRVKIGHTGTLDDFAEGLLIICVGRQATRQVRYLMNLQKEYIVKAMLGELTDTFDCTGRVIERVSSFSIIRDDIVKAMDAIGSSYEQTPPIFSALKFQGSPLYKLAREEKLDLKRLKEIVDAKKRTVFIHELELLELELPFFTFRAQVSKGTYIRSLVDDIAQNIGLHATIYELTRSKQGAISLDDSVRLDQIKSLDDLKTHLLSLDDLKRKLEID